MLLGGAQAAALATVLQGWRWHVRVVRDELGVASAIKMCRGVMIKGLEALVIESYTAARAYGAEDHVLPTLRETFPGIDWSKQGVYFFSRVAQRGPRHCRQAVGGRSGQGQCVQGRGPGRWVAGLCGRADRGPSRGG